MRVGRRLFDLARAGGARSIFFVGTGKGVGKTTALRAVYGAVLESGLAPAVAAIGPTPRLWLHPNTLFATARPLLPASPANEILELSSLPSPSGSLLYARVAHGAFLELAGPSTASGLREVLARLAALSELTLVDGAVDRVAALAGTDGAIVVACGAAAANTPGEAVDEVAALVARLSVAAVDPAAPALHHPGALTAADVAALIRSGEARQVVVEDPTQVAMSGKALTQALSRLNIRCRRPLRTIAVTVNAIARERSFEPATFARAVARATELPVFDVFAGIAA